MMSNIQIDVPVDYAKLIVRILKNHQSSSIEDLRRIGETVEMIESKINRAWNPDHDQKAVCECGHPYHRHFDGYEDMASVGCKYCECYTFTTRTV